MSYTCSNLLEMFVNSSMQQITKKRTTAMTKRCHTSYPLRWPWETSPTRLSNLWQASTTIRRMRNKRRLHTASHRRSCLMMKTRIWHHKSLFNKHVTRICCFYFTRHYCCPFWSSVIVFVDSTLSNRFFIQDNFVDFFIKTVNFCISNNKTYQTMALHFKI